LDQAGLDRTGLEQAGPEQAGPDRSEPDRGGLESGGADDAAVAGESYFEDGEHQFGPHALAHGWQPGADVSHPEFGHGWVQGSGHGVVTVRFETRSTGPGQARTFAADDPTVTDADPLDSLG
jgi:DNA polymerase-4